MIRPASINIENHTADFKCDEHGGTAIGLNVNTQLSYTENNESIILAGSLLSSPCDCLSIYPNEPDHVNEVIAQLAQAKTE